MSSRFRRVLTDDLIVSLDGILHLDDDVTKRTVTRVVVTMPEAPQPGRSLSSTAMTTDMEYECVVHFG